jgi:UDP-N-acetylmuramate dehydrogenase
VSAPGTMEIAATIGARIEGRVEVDHPLAMLTTYRVGGHASLYVEPAGIADVEGLAHVLRELRAGGRDLPVLTMGRGSNLVVSDRGWPGIVIRLTGRRWSWIEELSPDEGISGLSAGASTSLPLLANWAARRGLAGAEFLIAIPGSVGGAVRMNAGAHGSELSDCLLSARVFDLESVSLHDRSVSSLSYGYRSSELTEHHVVLDAKLRLGLDDAGSVRARMESYRRHRAETQPGALQNAGSVFKNPRGDHAGRLVEAAGLKGFRMGGAEVSELHANFFVARDGATAEDVHALVGEVARRVFEQFGVELTPEIKFVGEFGQRSDGSSRVADRGVTR